MKLLTCVLLSIATVSAENILMVFPIPSPSHQILGNELAKTLTKRGHRVTMLTPQPMKEDVQNLTQIVLGEMKEVKEKYMENVMSFNSSSSKIIQSLLKMGALSRYVLLNPEVKSLLKSNATFDLVIQEVALCESLLGLGHFYKAPTIVAHSAGSASGINELVGNSQEYAYVPTAIAPFTDEMTFFQRVTNILSSIFYRSVQVLIFKRLEEAALREFFPEAPPLDELKTNISLVLLNAHYSVAETPRPYLPNMIPIGGFHIKRQKLPNDLKTFLDEAKEGAILFSLGSNLKSENLPKEKLDAILGTFAKFPQRFLWKFEKDTLETPENVKISKWVPQRGVLGHSNVKAFITHGGLLSVTEAVYYGVPFIAIPAFADQPQNAKISAEKRFGIKLDLNDIDEERLTQAIKEILQNPEYRKNIALRSSLLRDQPVAPMDLAIYWIEHVLKYKGAPHLQNAGVKLGWIQSSLIDVFVFLFVVTFSLVYAVYIGMRKALRYALEALQNRRKLKTS